MADSKSTPSDPEIPEVRAEGGVAKTPSRMGARRVSGSSAKLSPPIPPLSTAEGWVPPTEEALQRSLPQFEILSLITCGGMGAVYKGRQLSLNRLVAIKILPAEGNSHPLGYAERFEQEAMAMAQFNHPCIVSVHDFGRTLDGLLYFVMEFVEGLNVEQMITAQGRLPAGEVARIVVSVCDALECAHGYGVIHRDIKPANVIVGTDGRVKVADFGLAKLPPAVSTAVTTADVNIGTYGFMAPEAFRADMIVDRRADIYGVGTMLYQMLTGQVPQGAFAPPSKLVPGLDVRFDEIVDRAMKPDREERYQTAAAMRADLLPLVPGPAPKPGRRMAAVWVASAVVLVAALGAVAVSSLRKKGDRIVSHPAVSMAEASREKPFVNSLGMEFVPVPGTSALFCRWETRVRDYAEFARTNTVDAAWKTMRKEHSDVAREPDHPVAGVSWEDARAFCEWLTEKEIAEGRLPRGACYRLPTDEEWSRAVRLGVETGATPKERSGNNGVDFPWGTGFPPPNGKAGNYADSAFHEKFPGSEWIDGYSDGFATTAPVGSYAPNEYGLYDLGGNVWEWCEDPYEPGGNERVMRGGSWLSFDRNTLASAFRLHAPPDSHAGIGFRCVVTMLSGRWSPAFSHSERIPGVAKTEAGWVRCKPEAVGLLAPAARGGNLVLRDGGVRVRFRGHEPAVPRWAKLEIRKGSVPETPALRYLPPDAQGGAAELRLEITVGGGRQFVTLCTTPVETPIMEGEEYTMELYAIGRLLVGRLNRQTITARMEEPAVPAEGALGIWGADRNFFRDFEVINLDGFPEADALSRIGVGKK